MDDTLYYFLEKDSEIERHIHNKQNRIIETTCEALILLSGKIEVEIYDNDLKFIDKFIVILKKKLRGNPISSNTGCLPCFASRCRME